MTTFDLTQALINVGSENVPDDGFEWPYISPEFQPVQHDVVIANMDRYLLGSSFAGRAYRAQQIAELARKSELSHVIGMLSDYTSEVLLGDILPFYHLFEPTGSDNSNFFLTNDELFEAEFRNVSVDFERVDETTFRQVQSFGDGSPAGTLATKDASGFYTFSLRPDRELVLRIDFRGDSFRLSWAAAPRETLNQKASVLSDGYRGAIKQLYNLPTHHLPDTTLQALQSIALSRASGSLGVVATAMLLASRVIAVQAANVNSA